MTVSPFPLPAFGYYDYLVFFDFVVSSSHSSDRKRWLMLRVRHRAIYCYLSEWRLKYALAIS